MVTASDSPAVLKQDMYTEFNCKPYCSHEVDHRHCVDHNLGQEEVTGQPPKTRLLR